jgi:hypothetical protein
MKKMIIAATAVGTAIAGIILYFGRSSSSKKQIENSPKAENNSLGKAKRLGQHAMG